jgi:hypothetical protein
VVRQPGVQHQRPRSEKPAAAVGLFIVRGWPKPAREPAPRRCVRRRQRLRVVRARQGWRPRPEVRRELSLLDASQRGLRQDER